MRDEQSRSRLVIGLRSRCEVSSGRRFVRNPMYIGAGIIFEKNAKHMSVKLESLISLIVLDSSCHPRLLSWQSFWKAGSARNGSQIGSSLRRAGVMGVGL